MKNTMLTLVLLTAALTACDKKKESDSKGSSKPSEAKAEKAAPKSGTIEQLKLAYDGPAGEVSDFSMGGDPNWMVQAPGLVFSVGTPKTPKTLESAIEDSKMYDGSTITVQEKTADGYHLEFHNTGSMGANYFIEVLRTINGTAYFCSTTAPDAATASAAVKACQSLRTI